MSFADQVFHVLGHALSSPQLRYSPDKSTGIVTSFQPISGAPLSLFAYLAMNSRPEIRAQEALLPYLVAAGFHVTRERSMCIDGTRRIFDFVVRPPCGGANDTGVDKDDFVVVELKHLGAQQTGGFSGLLGPVLNKKTGKPLSTLNNDFYKARPPVPMIQVGVFTAVDSWGTATAPVHWTAVDSPFVRRYVKGKRLDPNYLTQADLTLSAWDLNHRYTRPASWPAMSHFNRGPRVSYHTPTGVQVTGCVHYFLGIAEQAAVS